MTRFCQFILIKNNIGDDDYMKHIFSNKCKLFTGIFLFILSFIFSDLVCTPFSKAATSSVKIRYNGKNYKNKSKKMAVKYKGKTVTNKSYKALIINKNYMVSYADVFKKGMKVSCKYKKSTKVLTMSANGTTLKMTIGKKKAKLNNKTVKLPTAPLSVRYVSKKKTKILVPVNFVAKSLHFSYKKSGSSILLNEPLVLNCDNVTTYYTGVQGKIYYNHKLYALNSIPVIKMNGKMYAPAEQTIKTIMGLDYEYNKSNNKISIINEDTNKELILTLNTKQAILNDKEITLSAEPKLIKNVKKNSDIICIPLASVLTQLDYTKSWNKNNNYYEIQSKKFFQWEKELTTTQLQNAQMNYFHKFEATYKSQDEMGLITLQLTGTSSEIMNTLTVNRNSNVIEVTIPKSEYLLDKNQFSNFGEIVQKIDVTSKNDAVVLSVNCENVADYSYLNQNNTLILNILYTYGSGDGSVISYSLSIPKPNGITLADVTNQDLYHNKKFVITIKGNHVDYFNKNPIIINNSKITNLAVTKSGSNTAITVSTSSLMGYKIYDNGKNFQVKVAEPKKVYKNIIVLDAGHGGHDPGAQNKGTNEKDLNYKIIYTLMKDYFSSNAPEIKVYWTRTTDVFVTLADRAAFAKKMSADVFISLHMNSASNTSANGTEVYYSVSNNSSSFSGLTSQKMANLFKSQLISDLKTTNRGTKTAAYYVLKHNTVPSILIELGFISGNSDYSKLTDTNFQKNAAKSIYTGIVSLFKTYPTGR